MTDTQKKHMELREKLMNILYEVNGAPLGYYVAQTLQAIYDSLPEERKGDSNIQFEEDVMDKGFNIALSEVKQILTGEKEKGGL